MRVIPILLTILVANVSFALQPGIGELRALYYKAPSDKGASEKFLQVTGGINEMDNGVLLCYKGAAQLLRAKYVYNPYTKLTCFSNGKKLVEKAIKKDPDNLEIRFVRYCIQENTPGFLGYDSDMKVDKAIILRGWGALTDAELKKNIKNYMLQSKFCSSAEKSILL